MNRLKALREERGMKQSELGKLLNVKDAAISKYESGKVPLTGDTLLQLSKIFNVPIDYILGNEKYSVDYQNFQMDTQEFGLDFKCRLRETLEEKGISEKDFPKITGFHQEDADAYLYGNRIPSIEDLIKLRDSLHVSTDYLLGIDEDAPISNTDRYFLKTLTDRERSIVDVYRQLNEDNQDIIVGEMKKCLKEQRYEDSVAAETSMREAK